MITIAASLDSTCSTISSFGHGNPITMVLPEDGTRKDYQLPEEACCGTIAQLIAGCDMLLTSALGTGALRHLNEAGVKVFLVEEGSDLLASVARAMRGELPPAEPRECGHDHEHDHDHDHQGHGGCQHGHSHNEPISR